LGAARASTSTPLAVDRAQGSEEIRWRDNNSWMDDAPPLSQRLSRASAFSGRPQSRSLLPTPQACSTKRSYDHSQPQENLHEEIKRLRIENDTLRCVVQEQLSHNEDALQLLEAYRALLNKTRRVSAFPTLCSAAPSSSSRPAHRRIVFLD